jgi:hypothetical protein
VLVEEVAQDKVEFCLVLLSSSASLKNSARRVHSKPTHAFEGGFVVSQSVPEA